MEPDKLLIVAHPDDETLWGGANLLSEPGWLVVVSTHQYNDERAAEFFRTMSYANVTQYKMYDTDDIYTDDPDEADELYDNSDFETGLKELATKDWKIVLTHNEQGEYGHGHHKKVHRMVKSYFPQAVTFEIGEPLSSALAEVKRELMIFYSQTQDIANKIHDGNEHLLKPVERDHMFKEKLYVQRVKEVPKIIHQIWFGNPLETTSVRYNLMKGVEEVAKRNGYVYKLWTNPEMTAVNLPLTWNSIQESLEMGKNYKQSRYAQIADLARYEILHRFGGVYLDSLFDISDRFCDYIDEHSKDVDIIVANEDPCGLECKSADSYYMSNGFFACIPGCVVLKRLLHPETLKYIDFESKHINKETGPYFFRLGMKDGDAIHVIDGEKIYPFMTGDSDYREGIENPCVDANGNLTRDCLDRLFPNSLAVYQSGFGGSWSW
jgi:hypothetical protein